MNRPRNPLRSAAVAAASRFSPLLPSASPGRESRVFSDTSHLLLLPFLSFPPLPHLGEFRSGTFRHSHAGAKTSRSESHGQRRRVANKLALTVVEVEVGGKEQVRKRRRRRGEKGRRKRSERRRKEEQDGDGFQHSSKRHHQICKFMPIYKVFPPAIFYFFLPLFLLQSLLPSTVSRRGSYSSGLSFTHGRSGNKGDIIGKLIVSPPLEARKALFIFNCLSSNKKPYIFLSNVTTYYKNHGQFEGN